MKIQQDILIEDLKKDVQVLLKCVEELRQEKEALLIQPEPGKWSIAQILEHLNRYSKYYIPTIDKALTTSSPKKEAWFNSGMLGNYFTNMMKPKDVFDVRNKMKAMKDYSPDNNLNPEAIINQFVKDQNQLLQLLELSKQRSLNDIRIPISISKIVKLKLGDTFRFFIGHEQRHFIQARNALKTIGLSTDKFPAILQAAQL